MPETDYPYLRDALDDRFSGLTDAELDSVFATAFGDDVTPIEYEEFFSDLGKAFSTFARQAAPVAATALQGGLEGGMKGMKYGPYGALVGALAGGTGAALQKHTTGTGRDVGSVLSGVVNIAGGGLGGPAGAPAPLPPGPPTGAAPGATARPPATDQLMRLLATPELGQALAALIRGSNSTVPAGPGGTPVPANAYAGLLSALARESEAEASGWDEATAVPAYLVGPDGRLVADPSDPDQRSGRLLQLLSAQPREQEERDDGIETVVFPEDYPEAYDEAYDEAFDEYDEYEDALG
ncbi:hypothetical protein [Kribbella sp. NPDC003557]|uniref:hypothetical protein n=1 Tax=Kribbella sp. NPDC003557 TaxID=3154449 RepID=UPI0033B3A5FF